MSFLPSSGFLAPLIEGDTLRGGTDALLGEADRNVVALGLGIERIDDEEDAAAGLAQAHGQRAAASALGVELNVGAQLLHVFEGLVLIAAVDFKYRKDARHGCTGRTRVGHLQHVLVGRCQQIVPGCRRLQIVFLEELVVGHEHQRIVRNGDPLTLRLLEPGRQCGEGGRLVRLEEVLVDSGGEGLHRATEQHVDSRIVLFRDDPRQRLARGEAYEVDLDAGCLLELLEHGSRPVFGPDRIDVQRFSRYRRHRSDECQCRDRQDGHCAQCAKQSAWVDVHRPSLNCSCRIFIYAVPVAVPVARVHICRRNLPICRFPLAGASPPAPSK